MQADIFSRTWSPILRFSAFIVLALLLTACGPKVVKKETPKIDPDIARAEALFRAENYSAAAQLFQRIAARANAQERARYQLLAAEAFFADDLPEQAETVLDTLNPSALRGDLNWRYRLLNAELALLKSEPELALQQLRSSPPGNTKLADQRRYFRALSLAQSQAGNRIEQLNALTRLDALYPADLRRRSQIQQDILSALASQEPETLLELAGFTPEPQAGWLELAAILRLNDHDPRLLADKMLGWRTRHPTHPALNSLLDQRLAETRERFRPVSNIAILLPERGRFAVPAAAIRDGILAAWTTLPANERPGLKFYDVSDSKAVWPALNQAAQEGADIAIGPLRKGSVEQLTSAGKMPIPTLALNRANSLNQPADNLFQFSLAPEDDGQQLAIRAWADGKRYPLVFYAKDALSERVLNAFTHQWQQLSGSSPVLQIVDPSSHDFAVPISQALHLDQSEARHKNLQRAMGKKIHFEPRKRDDIDTVVLITKANSARELRPQLQYYYAGDLPVMAPSTAWNGDANPDHLRDLKNVLLPDLPWVLESFTPPSEPAQAKETPPAAHTSPVAVPTDESQANDRAHVPEIDPLARNQLKTLFPAAGSVYSKLYAMGMDAIRVTNQLPRLQSGPTQDWLGATGKLFLDPQRLLKRRMQWAKLSPSGVKLLDFTPSVESLTLSASALNDQGNP